MARRRVCMIAGVHTNAFESRIFHREARTLAQAGYDVTLITGHDRTETVDDVRIVGMQPPRSRWLRVTIHQARVLRAAWQCPADVYHFHSPEFIPYACLLRLRGPVIYDAHEAFRDKMATRSYLPAAARGMIGRVIQVVERLGALVFSHVLAADRHVARQFRPADVTVLANYPVLSQVRAAVDGLPHDRADGRTIVIYAGDLSRERGIVQMLDAMDLLAGEAVELRLLGRFEYAEDERRAGGMANVRYLGFQPLPRVFQELAGADVGLVVLQPVPAYRYAGENTNKLFEYMACGLAIVGSDFNNLRPLIEGAGTGVCVDPTSAAAIAGAIRALHADPAGRRAMGERGRAAVTESWNWEAEGTKLLALYDQLLSPGRPARVPRT